MSWEVFSIVNLVMNHEHSFHFYSLALFQFEERVGQISISVVVMVHPGLLHLTFHTVG